MKKIFFVFMFVLCSFLVSCSMTENKTIEKTKTEEKTPAQTEQEFYEQFHNVIPNSVGFEGITDTLDIQTSSGVSDVFEETTGRGYVVLVTVDGRSKPVDVIVGINKDGYIEGIDVTIGEGDFPVNEQMIFSFIGQDSTLSGVDFTSGATISSKAVKTAVENAFYTLESNQLIEPPKKSSQQIYEELLPTVYSSFVKGEELEVSGNIIYAVLAKNNTGAVCYVKDGPDVLMGVISAAVHIVIYKHQLIDESTETYELVDVTMEYLQSDDLFWEVAEIFNEHFDTTFFDYYDELSVKVHSMMDNVRDIEEEFFTYFGSIVTAAVFKAGDKTYYAYYSRPVNRFNNDVMDVYVILDSDGKIVKVDVQQYFFGAVEYYPVAKDFNDLEYESGVIGLTSETYHGYETMISGATYTSNAIEIAIRDALIVFNQKK